MRDSGESVTYSDFRSCDVLGVSGTVILEGFQESISLVPMTCTWKAFEGRLFFWKAFHCRTFFFFGVFVPGLWGEFYSGCFGPELFWS